MHGNARRRSASGSIVAGVVSPRTFVRMLVATCIVAKEAQTLTFQTGMFRPMLARYNRQTNNHGFR